MKKIIFISLIFVFILFNCKESTSPSNVTVDEAEQALEDVLYDIINSDNIESPENIDFSHAHQLFTELYQKNPADPDANFGLALTNMLMITQSAQMNNIFEEWEEFMNGNDPLAKLNKSNRNRTSLKPHFPTSSNSLKLDSKNLVTGYINLSKSAYKNPPKFSQIQSFLENDLIPRLNKSLSYLDVVDNNPDYTFIVSPRMQGDIEADPIEIDLTEIYTLEAGLHALKALADLTVAYNVDIWGLDSLAALATFSKGGDFLTLRNGNTPMQDAKSSILLAADNIEYAIDFCLNETDNQDDDLIKLSSSDQHDIDLLLEGLDKLRSHLNQPQVYTGDWDGDDSTPQEELTVNFSQLFDNPIEDLKEKLPDYTIAIQNHPVKNKDWGSKEISVKASITVANASYYYYYHYSSFWNEDYKNSNIEIPKFDQVYDSVYTVLKGKDNISDFYMDLWWNQELAPGSYIITATLFFQYEYTRIEFNLYLPSSFTWNDPFDQWIFPDPTFNGFLPGMTDAEFKRIFGITEDKWEESIAKK
jgi:hypothetical protein